MRHLLHLGLLSPVCRAPEGGAGDGAAAAGGDGAAAAAVAAAAAGGNGSGGNGASLPDWFQPVDADVRSFIETKGWKPENPSALISALGKGYIGAEKLVGVEKIPVPGKDAPAELWETVYDRLGRPKDGKYQFTKPEGAGEAFDLFADKIGKMAHAAGLNQKQADQVVQFMAKFGEEGMAEQSNRQKAAFEAGVAALRSEWGAKYEGNVEIANRGAAWLGGDFAKLAGDLGLANNPVFVKAMNKLGAATADDSIVGGGKNGSFAMTPEEAKAEIAKMEGDPKHPIFRKDHPEHKLAVERKSALFKMAYPDDSRAA